MCHILSEIFLNEKKVYFPFVLQLLEGSFAREVSHEVDGLIFQPTGVSSVKMGFSPFTLKWNSHRPHSSSHLLPNLCFGQDYFAVLVLIFPVLHTT